MSTVMGRRRAGPVEGQHTFAIVAAKGDMYAGLWYPSIIVAVSFLAALFFETADCDRFTVRGPLSRKKRSCHSSNVTFVAAAAKRRSNSYLIRSTPRLIA